MTLNKAPLPIIFAGGVETGVDSKQVPTTKLLDLQNCVFDRTSVLKKRNGYQSLSTQIQDAAGNIASARGLGARDGEVLTFTDKRCFSYRPSNDRLADTGEVAATTLTTLPIGRTGTYQTQGDLAERNGIRVLAWEDSRSGVWCSVIEAATGRYLLSQAQLDASGSARNPTCLAVGEVIHVLWTREDLGRIYLALINPAVPTAAPVVSILTEDLDGTKPFYDAEPAPFAPSGAGSRPGLIAWAQAGGGFRIGYLAPSGLLGSPLTGLPSVATFADLLTGPIAVSHDPADAAVAVGWIGGASVVRIRILSATTLTSTAFYDPVATSAGYTRITLAWGAALPSGATGLYWSAEVTAARSDLCSVDSGAIDSTSGTPGPSTKLRGHGLVSRAWHDGGDPTAVVTVQSGDVYALVAHTVRLFPYVAALRLSGPSIAAPSAVIVSRLMPGEASGSLMRPIGAGTRAWTQHLPSVLSVGLVEANLFSRQRAIVVPYRIQLSSTNGDQFSEQGLKLATIDFDAAYHTAQLGRGLYLASSAPMHYDGESWREADFHCAPDIGFDTTGVAVALSTVITPIGGGAIPAGSYLYGYWYEGVDAQGELHRGPVIKVIGTNGVLGKFSHAIPTCRLTRFATMRICVARSEIGATGTDASIPLYRVTSNDVTVTTGSNRYILNDPTVDTVTFVDDLTDAITKTREPLYTNGGVLSNSPAPWAGGVIAGGKSRLYWTDSSDPTLVRYSQEIADDTALEAPVDLSLRVDPFGGDVKAIAVMDGAVYPLCETAVYVFGGRGPARDGGAATTDGFSAAELVTSDAGCSSPGSVCDSPVGLMFQSSKGIKLLDRSRQMRDVGAPVAAYDDQTIKRMTLLPDRQSIVALTDAGRTLLWDYRVDQWSTFSNHEGLDAVVVGGTYYYLRNDSRVFVETPGVYRDDNSQIPMTIETAWIHFPQYLQGWQKILYAYFLGTYQSPHTLSIRYRIDYNDAYSAAILSNVNANYSPSLYGAGLYGAGAFGGAGGGGTRYQRRIHLNRRCQSISFLIQDIEATGDFGASFELTELLTIGGGIGSDFKVGASRSA